MKIQSIYTLILCAILTVCTVSCDENVNDWPVDPSYETPFRPTAFGKPRIWATAIELSYQGVTDAGKYVFEFSEGDSLLFDNIVRTVEILADTLTVYSDNVAPTKRVYRTIFEDLKGTTRYSVRVKAVDKNNRETGYVEQYFDTPAEQVMRAFYISRNSFRIEWDVQRPVNKVRYGLHIEGEETVYEERALTPDEQSAGAVTLDGLEQGTAYDIQVMLDDQLRGSRTLSTTGRKGYETITVPPTETGASIKTKLTELVGLGKKNIVLEFLRIPGGRYEIGQINIPDGISNLCFTGASMSAELPQLFLHAVRLEGAIQDIRFENIAMDGDKNGSNFFFDITDAAKTFKNVSFTGCEIRDISRSLVYFRNIQAEIDTIQVENCIISNVSGSYGVYNVGGAGVHVKLASFTNTTFREIGDQFSDIRGPHDRFIMDYITFCNYTATNLPELFLWSATPGEVKTTNSIFTGTNADKPLDATNSDRCTMDFSGCYKTNDWTYKANSKYPFTNITEVNMSGEELFVDPRNGDFRIKEGVRFAGANKVGDPRWWVIE